MGQIILTPQQMKTLVDHHREAENSPLNAALLSCALCWGLKPNELAGLLVHHVVDPSGDIRKLWALPGDVAYNGHDRWVHARKGPIRKYLNDYVDWLVSVRGKGASDEYRGLDPAQPFFMDRKGSAFKLGSIGNGKASTAMNNYLKQLIERSPLGGQGIAPGSLRRTYGMTMLDQDVTVTLVRSCGACRHCARGEHVACTTSFALDETSPLTDHAGATAQAFIDSDPRAVTAKVKGIYRRL